MPVRGLPSQLRWCPTKACSAGKIVFPSRHAGQQSATVPVALLPRGALSPSPNAPAESLARGYGVRRGVTPTPRAWSQMLGLSLPLSARCGCGIVSWVESNVLLAGYPAPRSPDAARGNRLREGGEHNDRDDPQRQRGQDRLRPVLSPLPSREVGDCH